MSDMTTCLNDLSYIPPNNEQNEPTQGDIGETSNELTHAKCNEFEELYVSANEELYPGCDSVTRLEFMEKFTHFKVKGLADDGFNPFGNLSQSYSMWPVILTTYNLPLWLCMKDSSLMLTLLIPCPKSPSKDIDVYLRPLIDDLKDLRSLKAKPEGSIAEGYVAKEALTFSSHYFWDVTMKFNRPDRNVNCPPTTCQFQVFRSICKSIGKRSVIRFDQQELKKVIWYVLHNSPGIHMYWAKFKSEFPNQDMKEEFPGWFGSQIRQRYIDKDPGVSVCVELFALACGPTLSPISVNSCVVNGVRFVVHSRDERRTTQNNGICSPGEMDGEIYYGQLKEILEVLYMSFKVVLFRVKWFDTSNEGCKIKCFVIRNNITQIWAHSESFKDDQYILATQVKQVFYLKDMARRPPD
ncbi:isovaleryl-CoA dehydrogenase, mitochondrial [Tanacetum coccineum]